MLNQRDPFRTTMKWLGLLIALGTIGGGLLTVLGTYVYAEKREVMELKTLQALSEGKAALRDYRLDKLEVQVQNIENIARRTDINVEKLLAQKRIIPAPAAIIQPLPSPPPPDSLADEPADPGE